MIERSTRGAGFTSFAINNASGAKGKHPSPRPRPNKTVIHHIQRIISTCSMPIRVYTIGLYIIMVLPSGMTISRRRYWHPWIYLTLSHLSWIYLEFISRKQAPSHLHNLEYYYRSFFVRILCSINGFSFTFHQNSPFIRIHWFSTITNNVNPAPDRQDDSRVRLMSVVINNKEQFFRGRRFLGASLAAKFLGYESWY